MKRNQNAPDIPALLKKFLVEHLQNNQNASPNTISSYRDALLLFLEYLQKSQRVRPEKIALKDLSVKNVVGFLDYLQKERKNGISTRNSRLMVFRSFVKYLLLVNPTWAGDLQGILAIPVKKGMRTQVDYLTKEEITLILESPDPKTWIGRRDRLLLLLMYNTGARVSEIAELKVSDLNLAGKGKIHLLGKGRKERSLPLWKNTAKLLKEWIQKDKLSPENPLFRNKRGKPITRFVITNRLDVAVKRVSKSLSVVKRKCITPHMIRHTTAMHFLQAGVDITTIAMWLGHESIETTQIYVTADIEMKEKALKTLQEPMPNGFRYKPSDSLLAFLENL